MTIVPNINKSIFIYALNLSFKVFFCIEFFILIINPLGNQIKECEILFKLLRNDL
jgi:hypothetical protein